MLLVVFASNAQNLSDYTFRTGTNASRWLTLTQPDTLFGPNNYYDDNVSPLRYVGFPFIFAGEIADSFSVSVNGYMHLGSSPCDPAPEAGKINPNYASASLPKISGAARDLSTGDHGYIYCQLLGAAPRRILVCEFALARDYSSVLPPDLRFQIQLHEDSSKVVIAYHSATPSAAPQYYQTGLAATITDIRAIDPITHTDSICQRPYSTQYSQWHDANRYYEYIRPQHTCPQPYSITARASVDSALVTWRSPSAANAWVVEYLGAPFTPGCQQGHLHNCNDTSLLLTNLTPNTLYHLYIHSTCGNDTSGNIHTTFRTNAAPSACPPPTSCRTTQLTTTGAVLHWQEAGTAQMWLVEWDTAGFAHGTGNSLVVTADSLQLTGLSPATLYDVYIYPSCGIDSIYLLYTFCTEGTGNLYIMRSGSHSITTCSATITDDGGPSAHYSHNAYNLLTVNPTAGNTITLQGYCSSELNYDFLDIYDGTSTAAPRLAHISGPNQPVGPITATNGPLTILFTSDGTVQQSGYSLTASCSRLSSCPLPYGLTVSAATTNSLSVSFSDTAFVGSYTLRWSTLPDLSQPTGSATFSTTHYTITSLQPATTYYLWLRSNCPTDSSNWLPAAPATTACGLSYATATSPFAEDFENPSLPTCWSQQPTVGNALWYSGSPSSTPGSIHTPHSGSHSLIFYGNDGTTTRLVSPLIDISALHTPQLSFWHTQEAWGNDQDVLSVYCRRNDGDAWTPLASYTGNIDTWTQELIALPTSYSTCQIAFLAQDNYGFGIMLDDVAIHSAVTPCPPPTAISIEAGGHIAIVSWPETGRFNLSYKAFADTQWVEPPISVQGSSHLLGGLRPKTAYSIRLRTDCSDNHSDWLSSVFITSQPNTDTTVLPCPKPTGLTLDSNGVGWAAASWHDDGSHSAWLLHLRGGRTIDTTVTSNHIRLRGLMPSTTYSLSLQSLCDSTRHSFLSDTITFTTDSGSLESIQRTAANRPTVTICPNPTSQGWFDLLIDGQTQTAPLTVSLCDATGRTLLRNVIADCHTTRHRIELPNLPAGIYIVTVSSNDKQTLHRLAILPRQ